MNPQEYWYRWHPSLYRANTLHLSLEHDCLYRRLIDYYMEARSPLPDNNQALARICGVSIECFENAEGVLKAFFEHSNGVLRHRFCDAELDRQDGKAKQRSAIAQRAAEKRWSSESRKNKGLDALSMPDAMPRDARGEERKGKENKKEKTVSGREMRPDDVPDGIWLEFVSLRKVKKAPITQTVIDAYRAEASKAGIRLEDAIRYSVINGYAGFKADWYKKPNTAVSPARSGATIQANRRTMTREEVDRQNQAALQALIEREGLQ